MHSEVTDLRIERRAPRASGLGGGWFIDCKLGGRPFAARWHSRDLAPLSEEDARAWEALSQSDRDRIYTQLFAAFEAAQLADYHRKNRQRQLELGMRIQLRLALRDRAMRPVARPAVVACRPAPCGARALRPRRTRVAARRGPPGLADEGNEDPDDVVRASRQVAA
jgi:hypothetical protein